MDYQLVSTLAAALSALGAAAAAGIMLWQTMTLRKDSLNQATRLVEAHEHQNRLSQINNRILINQMWNDFNKMIVEGDEELLKIMGSKSFRNLDPGLVKRVYVQFYHINVIEVAWLLNKIDGLSPNIAGSTIYDHSVLLRNDAEAAKLALDGRGYSKEFVDAVWSFAFPNETRE